MVAAMPSGERGGEPLGVVLLNLGGPENEAQVQDFLRRLLSDPDVVDLAWPLRQGLARWVARRRSKRVVEHYRLIGGRSPLAAQTRSQVEALRASLGDGFMVRFAFRHSSPFADPVVAGLAEAGVRRLVALPAYPQWSRSTSGSAVRDLQRAAQSHGVEVCQARSYPDAAGYIEALAAATEPLLLDGAHLIVSAHGLPMRLIRKGDPYLDEVRRTFAALQARLPAATSAWLAFQSRLGPVAWTGPYLTDEIARLAEAGVRNLVVTPVSFVAENLETLYELDHEVADWARQCGIQEYRRAPVPGCHPAFIGELAGLVRATVREADWEVSHGA